MLREVAREITPKPDRDDLPASGDEAHKRLRELVLRLQDEAPRFGLGAATGEFVDHVAGVAGRYGRQLFHCYDDPRIPSTTNGLEGFFGSCKSHIRTALGSASTTNCVAQNLGADYLEALVFAQRKSRDKLLEAIESVSLEEYIEARDRVTSNEQPARLRRSRRRDPEGHLIRLLDRWEQSDNAAGP